MRAFLLLQNQNKFHAAREASQRNIEEVKTTDHEQITELLTTIETIEMQKTKYDEVYDQVDYMAVYVSEILQVSNRNCFLNTRNMFRETTCGTVCNSYVGLLKQYLCTSFAVEHLEAVTKNLRVDCEGCLSTLYMFTYSRIF